MHLIRRYLDATELQVTSRTGIMHDGDPVSEVSRGAGRRIYAIVTHGSNDDDIFDTIAIKHLLQSGISKCVGMVLHDDRLFANRSYGGMYLSPLRSGREHRGVGGHEFVPDIDHRNTALASRGDHARGVSGGGFDPNQRQLAGCEIFALNIDDDDCALAH